MSISGRWRWALAALAAVVGIGSPVAASGPIGPWEPGEGGEPVTDADGRTGFIWPPVPDSYIETAPLGAIAAWIVSARRDEAAATGREYERGAGEVVLFEKRMTVCFVDAAALKVKPLTPAQWNALAHRGARSLRLGTPEEATAAVRLAEVMDGFPVEPDWPADGFCALADGLLVDRAAVEPGMSGRVARLAAGFARRAGYTGFLRHVAGLMRDTPDASRRAYLAVAAAGCLPAGHDLNAAESAVLGAELLAAAEEARDGGRQRAITTAAMSLGGPGSDRLWDLAIDSGHADVRRAALQWVTERARMARFMGDARTERSLRSRTGRMIEAIGDSDEQVAASAMVAVIAVLQHDPALLCAELSKGLGTRATGLDVTACYALAGMPQHAAPALGGLRALAASSDPDLSLAASEAVRAIEADARKPEAGGGP